MAKPGYQERRETSLSLAVTEEGGVATLHVGGEVDISSCPAFRTTLLALAKERRSKLVVDMSRLVFMDSSGLHALFEAAQLIGQKGGTLVLLDPSQDILRMLEIAGVLGRFVIENSSSGPDKGRALPYE